MDLKRVEKDPTRGRGATVDRDGALQSADDLGFGLTCWKKIGGWRRPSLAKPDQVNARMHERAVRTLRGAGYSQGISHPTTGCFGLLQGRDARAAARSGHRNLPESVGDNRVASRTRMSCLPTASASGTRVSSRSPSPQHLPLPFPVFRMSAGDATGYFEDFLAGGRAFGIRCPKPSRNG